MINYQAYYSLEDFEYKKLDKKGSESRPGLIVQDRFLVLVRI